MKRIITTALATMVAVFGYSQQYLPLTAGSGSTLSGDLYMQSGNPQLFLINGTSTGRNWKLNSYSNGNFYIGVAGQFDALTLNGATGNAAFSGALTGTSATFTGNFGIGTTNTDIGGSGDRTLTLQGTNVRSTIQLSNTSTGTNGIAGSLKAFNSNTFIGSVDMFADGAANSGGFQFYTVNAGTNIAAMRIASTGNVSIGTHNPQGYKLAVAGNVIAESVKVALQGNWPDYVFKPNNKLRSLAEVEKFVQENNHLPEMPSEEEVQKEGINLGQMDAKLLQKIEELTLYMIDLKKTWM
jgi:hypothetical protein